MKSVVKHPLNLTDPDYDSRQLGGVRVDLNAVHDLRPHRGEFLWGLEGQSAPEYDVALKILQRLKSDVEKITRPAGRVQNCDTAQPVEKCAKDSLGPIVLSCLCRRGRTGRSQSGFNFVPHFDELLPERSYNDWLDELENGLPVSIVCAELSPFSWV